MSERPYDPSDPAEPSDVPTEPTQGTEPTRATEPTDADYPAYPASEADDQADPDPDPDPGPGHGRAGARSPQGPGGSQRGRQTPSGGRAGAHHGQSFGQRGAHGGPGGGRGGDGGHGAQRRGRGAPPGPWAELLLEALHQAALRGSRTVEAEHVLLAVTVVGSPDTKTLLADAGLDHDRLSRALRDERRAALARIGFHDPDEATLVATPRDELTDRSQWGTSIREAMSRSRRVGTRGRGGRSQNDADLVLGILLANLGTVPRALQLAGIDLDALIGRIQRARAG